MAEHSIEPIDMIVVNLYPFEKTVEDKNVELAAAVEKYRYRRAGNDPLRVKELAGCRGGYRSAAV
jgi:hypothetical protein